MSFKTDRLAALFPTVYAAREGSSLLRTFLDAIGFELMGADESVKRLLKSHWVNYAQDDALDGLAATFGVERRTLPDGKLEPDDAFRRRLRAIVPYFTGGGTVKAVKGAVRSALGLPYDLQGFANELAGPAGDSTGKFDALINALDNLVRIEEFSPKSESVIAVPVTHVQDPSGDLSTVTVEVGFSSIFEASPRIEWTFTRGGARALTLRRLDSGAGIKSKSTLKIDPGATLVLTAGPGGSLAASIGITDISAQFTDWDGSSPPRLPELPGVNTSWQFTAKSGLFDFSSFDDTEGFDTPEFTVRFQWIRREPLTFNVIVPYFIQDAVAQIKQRTGFAGNLFAFAGLPLEVIQKVVDQTRAAGVRGMVQFSLNFSEDHAAGEQLSGRVDHRYSETQDQRDALIVGSVNSVSEQHNTDESFAIGADFGLATFDSSFGFM